MLCPNCGRHFSGSQATRSNIRGLENVDIIYDISCPFCQVQVAKMFWGRLIVRDDLPPPHRRPLKAHPVQPGPPEEAVDLIHTCPHCGKDLPEDLSQLPVRRRGHDRRDRDRRNSDRRRQQQPFAGPDRRGGDRRQGERRGDTPAEAGRRQGDRRKLQRPILFERRMPGKDRRRRAESEDINRSI